MGKARACGRLDREDYALGYDGHCDTFDVKLGTTRGRETQNAQSKPSGWVQLRASGKPPNRISGCSCFQ